MTNHLRNSDLKATTPEREEEISRWVNAAVRQLTKQHEAALEEAEERGVRWALRHEGVEYDLEKCISICKKARERGGK
jgi:Arc/MetJ family transcription regulator